MGAQHWLQVPMLWINPSDVGRHLETNENKRDQICGDIDANGFGWQVWAVAASGFFTDSYNLFATNVILPSLAFVYWHEDTSSDHETAINAITLTGSLLGQLIFGFLADRYGRRKLYGLELIVVIFGTLGFVQSSAGYNGSMRITGWLMFWRFFVGLGIGAEYPLSSVITAEFAPRRSRARMMASVFLMQPLGQLLAAAVGLATLLTVGRNAGLAQLVDESDHEAAAKIVDQIWRYVVGVGAIPALVAIIFRITIPESPRYTLDVDQDGARALRDTRKYYNIHRRDSNGGGITTQFGDVEESAGLADPPRAVIPKTNSNVQEDDDSMEVRDLGEDIDAEEEEDQDEPVPDPFSYLELKRFFWDEGNGTYLLGTSVSWFLLDFAFFGLGINNPRVIAQIWSSEPITNVTLADSTPDWATPSDQRPLSIYADLKSGGINSIITISIGSMLGSIILIKLIDYVPRKAWLSWSFIGMAVLFAIVGGSYFRAANSNLHGLTITLYVFCQLLFNLGPNTLTFILPAEIFPTRYRGTCHGISAASGKLGSIIVQAFLPYTQIINPNSHSLGWILIGFSFAMLLGALFSWAWIPEVQNERGSDTEKRIGRSPEHRKWEVPSKTLEELAKGRMLGVEGEREDAIGFRRRGGNLIRRVGKSG